MGKTLNNIYLIVGRSGSGKDTIVNALCNQYSCSKVLSYTTRSERKGERNTHTFVSDEEMDRILKEECVVAFTNFAGHRYCATLDQVCNSDFYIIDMDGVRYMKEKNDILIKKKIICIGIEAGTDAREVRMAMRGDDKTALLRRVQNDFKAFAGFENEMDAVFINEDLEECVNEIWWFIQKMEIGSGLG